MESEVSLPCPQKPSTFPYPKAHKHNPQAWNSFCKIHFIIILPSIHTYSKWSLVFSFPEQILNSRPNIEHYYLLTTPPTCPFYPIFFDLITQIKSTKRETLHYAVFSVFLLLLILRLSYFPQRFIFGYPPHMSLSRYNRPISHPCDTAEKSLILNSLFFLHAHCEREHKRFWTEW